MNDDATIASHIEANSDLMESTDLVIFCLGLEEHPYGYFVIEITWHLIPEQISSFEEMVWSGN